MLWRRFSAAGPGRLLKVEGKMNAAKNRENPEDNQIQSAIELRLWRFIFQQDNDQKCAAKASQKRFKDNIVNIVAEQFCKTEWSKIAVSRYVSLIET